MIARPSESGPGWEDELINKINKWDFGLDAKMIGFWNFLKLPWSAWKIASGICTGKC